MQLSEQIRRGYERRPYPAGDDRALQDRTWRIAPMEWIEALWRNPSEGGAPERILIAGCGAGTEAFNMKRRFPNAKMVGVDFSPRSIAVARHLQKKESVLRDIRFITGNLASPTLRAVTGGSFDFISCHGVLSYIPKPEQALVNLARCLKPNGALYLGVNGADHISLRFRRALPRFGFNMSQFQDSTRVREALKLCDAVLGLEHPQCIATQRPEYLSGDVFGPLIHNWTFAQWKAAAGRAGLQVAGSYLTLRNFRPIAEHGLHAALIPKTRAEVIEFLEDLAPAPFHALLLTAASPVNPPWHDDEGLLGCRVRLTRLYAAKLPRPASGWKQRRRVTFKSPATNLLLEFSMPAWQLEVLRESHRQRTLGEILKAIPCKVPFTDLREFLYLLHQLAAIQVQS
jgi:ubiquinone/menaquinone biosynthesis C-methylase UbiE